MLLITGGRGLLGSELSFLHKESVSLSSKDVDLTKYNINNFLTPEIDAVIHCAAKVGGVKSNTDFVADFFDDNMKINMNVIESCMQNKVKLVSILSTCVYPDSSYVKYPLTEDQLHNGPPHDSNYGYAYAKRMLEVQTRAYRQQHGCNFISVIPNNLYGVHDNYDMINGHVIPALIRRFYEAKVKNKDRVVVWGSGRPMREFTFARDAASIILWLTANYEGSQPINIGNSAQVSIRELAETISEIIEFDGKIVFDETKPDGQYQKPSSNQKLLELGWKGHYTPLSVGLSETITQFLKNYPQIRGIANAV